MKQVKFISVFILLFLASAWTNAFAVRVYVPDASNSMTSSRVFCNGATPTNLSFTYGTCNSGSGGSSGVTISINWYVNSTNSTSGGTLVSTTSGSTATAGSGSVTYTPSTATNGVSYYYCVLTWTGSGTCNTSGSLTSATTTRVTVSDGPSAVTGSNTACTGTTETYTNTTSGGTWTSSNTAVATISASGVLTPVAAGTMNVTYTASCGGTATKLVSVYVTPALAAIGGGTSNICTGSTTTLTNTTSGGTWTSANTAVATITSGGVVTGVAIGTATISYQVTNPCGSDMVTKIVTVSASPATIAGGDSVCVGSTETLSNTVPYGVWSSSNTARATVSTSGVVTGVAVGAVSITYTTGCGTTAINLMTVNATPGSVTGTATACVGGTTTFANTVSGGTWISSNTAIATVGTGGIVTGVANGTSTITYSLTNACGSFQPTRDVYVTSSPTYVNAGSYVLCVGGTPITYTSSAPYGTWSSNNTATATVDVNTGVVTAVATGTTRISYITTCGFATKVLTVNAAPGAISGTTSVCAASSTPLTNSASGGTWTSSNTAVGTVSTTGSVTGVANGTCIISYSTGPGCVVTTTVTVRATPAAISGASTICSGGATTTFTNTVLYGTWSSSSTARATVNASTGVITSVAAGTTRITYNTGCGTAATKILTVNASPAAITGTATVCDGATNTLADATSGGTWSTANVAIATVGSTGIVTGVAGGTTTITYALSTGCNATTIVTVTSLPDVTVPSGQTICNGATQGTLSFSSSVSGTYYLWTNSNSSIGLAATATGTLCGTANENANVVLTAPTGAVFTAVTFASYGNPSGSCGSFATGSCHSSTSLSIVQSYVVGQSTATIPATNAVFGDPCAGTTKMLYVQATYAYSVVPSFVATNTGGASIVGTVTVTPAKNGCSGTPGTFTITVNNAITAGTITGTAVVCEAATTTLSNATIGGAWSSSNTAVATVGTTGVVSGVAAGTATISYAYTNSCGTDHTTKVVTVNPLPAAGTITGTAVVCESATTIDESSMTTLNNATTGGVWTSSNTAVATVGTAGAAAPTARIVTGMSAGTATISYTYTNSCGSAYATQVVTVNPLPAAGTITGTALVCEAATTTLSNAKTGGIWSSSNTAVATIGTTGVVSGVAAGTATISYTYTNSCGTAYDTQVVTVNPLPAAGTITGTAVVCEAATTTLSNDTTGGVWSSSNTAVATVGTTGVVSGVAAGTATISYTYTNSCGTDHTTQVVTVNPLPAPGTITGTAVVCDAATTTLSNATTGGVWSSSNTAVANIGTTGIVNGLAAGTATISYAYTNSCGTDHTIQVVTVNPLPVVGTITGTAVVCEAATITLSNDTTGGVWSSSNTAVATIGTAGEVSGVVA